MAWTLPVDCVLGIFGKKPDQGSSLGGLVDEWGLDIAAEIREASLFDTLDVWDSSATLNPGGRRVLVYAPEDAGPWFDERVPASFAMQPRADGDFGRSIRAFLAGELEDGADRVVVIDSDAPSLDPTIVVSAFLCLEGRDLVIGPAANGGCYLVGVRREAPPIFEGLDWNSPIVLSRLLDRLAETGLSLSTLPPWYRIARPDDMRMLAGHLRALRRSGFDPGLPRLERLSRAEWLDSRG